MYLIRRAWANVKNEILVLPSRTLVAVWVLGLALLPLAWPDPYILRIVTLTCLFAIFAARAATRSAKSASTRGSTGSTTPTSMAATATTSACSARPCAAGRASPPG